MFIFKDNKVFDIIVARCNQEHRREITYLT